MAPTRHLIFSTSKAALAGYKQNLGGQSDVQVELFHYSEQDGLDTDALEAQVLSASEVSVLLLATAASSYLWFDAEHYPRNVELCTILSKFPEVRVSFIVCPTTESARNAWQQHSSDFQSVFRGFLPETGRVDTWTKYNPEQEIESEQIRSLISRVATHLTHQNIRRPQMSIWDRQIFWVAAFALLALHSFWLQWQLQTQQREMVDLLAAAESCTVLGTQVRELHDNNTSHGKMIAGLGSSIKSQAQSISELGSISESHGEKLSSLSSQFEGLQRRAKLREESEDIQGHYIQMTEIRMSKNQSPNAYSETCQNGQSRDHQWLERLKGSLEGIRSTLAAFLPHSVASLRN